MTNETLPLKILGNLVMFDQKSYFSTDVLRVLIYEMGAGVSVSCQKIRQSQKHIMATENGPEVEFGRHRDARFRADTEFCLCGDDCGRRYCTKKDEE
ncbi:MAG TPA: hypothetical protein PLZ12_16500 [Saprospiraceae bacterium]|nr:hypothetical protein [Saprospiraceae bacterium]